MRNEKQQQANRDDQGDSCPECALLFPPFHIRLQYSRGLFHQGRGFTSAALPC